MQENIFIPHHMNITTEELKGNKGIGRYILLPGSDGRAETIAQFFSKTKVYSHPRHHNLYTGTIDSPSGEIDVGVIATGMGAPSVDIIVQELYHLGGKRFIRIGTAGSFQPEYIRAGSLVIPTAAVRDEGTSSNYIPLEIPAVASPEIVQAAVQAMNNLKITNYFTGTVHTKDSLFAREFKSGPLASEHWRYTKILHDAGIIASEMECSLLFTLGAVMTQEQIMKTKQYPVTNKQKILTGAILSIIGDDDPFSDPDIAAKTVDLSIQAGLETIRILAANEGKQQEK